MSGLGAKARRLELARGIGRDGAVKAQAAGLVWVTTEAEIDAAALGDGELVVSDYTVTQLGGDEPSVAVRRDRVTLDPEDHGRVFARDGREIGAVLRGGLLEFTWPEDLAAAG